MTRNFPYTYIGCTCNTQAARPESSTFSRRVSHQVQTEDDDTEDQPLDPHDPRTNFSLFPYEYLLYCDECHETRCPRCWTEEIMNWYCPSCLFEVPSSIVKTDGSRCARNCYNCPICTAPLSINALDQQGKDHLSPQDASQPSGPFFLSCPYCEWSSLDIGIQFSKPTKITEQLARLRKRKLHGNVEASTPLIGHDEVPEPEQPRVHSKDAMFANLTRFYKSQLHDSDTAPGNPYGDSSYNSPNNLARIMQIYGGLSTAALKKSREKPLPMREALTPSEGLEVVRPDQDNVAVSRLRQEGRASTTTFEQRSSHPWNQEARFTSDLWPVPALLRTRRSKRCQTCRHILIKLDDRKGAGGGSSKYKIRLLAQNHIPRLTLRLFHPGISPSTPNPSPAFALTPASLKALSDTKDWHLQSHKPIQYLLTLTNPLFEPVKVTLATPSTTPGTVKSKVTILCPTFDIGADGDMWDEALSSSADQTSQSRSRSGAAKDVQPEDRQPEAGKIWARGRNWTSVVVEVVPGSLHSTTSSFHFGPPKPAVAFAGGDETESEEGGLKEGDDVLEIPILVRVEWEAEVAATEESAVSVGTVAKGGKVRKQGREVGFWAVVGAGRIVG